MDGYERVIQFGNNTAALPVADGTDYAYAYLLRVLGNILGLFAENNRGDIWSAYNIDWDLVANRECLIYGRYVVPISLLLTDYDYYSIMVGDAPPCSVNVNGAITRDYATVKNSNIPKKDVYHQLSPLDIVGINKLYKDVIRGTNDTEVELATHIDVISQWQDGFCVNVNIVNDTGSRILGWHGEMVLDGQLYSSWLARVQLTDNVLKFNNYDWNGAFESVATAQYGFCSSGTDIPQAIKIRGYKKQLNPKGDTILTVVQKMFNSWSGGYCTSYTISNESNKPIGFWQVEFNVGTILLGQTWGAENISDQKQLYALGVGLFEPVEFGFCVAGENVEQPIIVMATGKGEG